MNFHRNFAGQDVSNRDLQTYFLDTSFSDLNPGKFEKCIDFRGVYFEVSERHTAIQELQLEVFVGEGLGFEESA